MFAGVVEYYYPYAQQQNEEVLLVRRSLKHLTMKFSCSTCEQTFKKKDKLTRHINAKHSKMDYPCPNCWRVFNRKDNLSQHMKTHKDVMEADAQIREKTK